jgi:hypothetical protein
MSTVSGDIPNAHIVEVEKDNINIFDVGASMQKSLCTLVTGQLSLFWSLFILLFKCVDHIVEWCIHENHFPNVDFLARQIFGIPKFQIETKRTFSLVGVLTTLRFYYLQVVNLDRIVIVVKKIPKCSKFDFHNKCKL